MGSCLSSESRNRRANSPRISSLGVQRSRSLKRRLASRSSEHKKEERLSRIPGRMFLNGASGIACQFSKQGKKGANQDAMVSWENFCSRMDTVFCGIFDGHGPYGHMVAKRVRDLLPLKLNEQWEISIKGDASSAASPIAGVGSSPYDLFQMLEVSFLKAFKAMDRELRLQRSIDCFCSGTTAVTLIKQGEDLIVGNIGDSRAVLGTRDEHGALLAIQLTVDLKPNLPEEAERIRKCRGRVFALKDEPDVERVWLPDIDSPGLAMTRAFGDFCLKDFGLISVPEVSHRHLTEKDEFVVLATDGIWDVLSNEEVVDIIASVPLRSSAARSLVEEAIRAWKLKYPTSKIDDCAVICLFIGSKTDICSAAAHEDEAIELHEEDDALVQIGLQRSGTVRSGEGLNVLENSEGDVRGVDSEIDWSAIEGVSRVDTLLSMPRFVPGNDDRTGGVAG